MQDKLVSIIITTYKRPNKLVDAINSVLNQTYKRWELIIVDDNNDNKWKRETKKKIKKYLNNDKIKYISHKYNKGYPAARNTGIKNASGEFIAFLDDDDIWLPKKLELQLKKFDDPEVGLVYSGKLGVTENGEIYNNNEGKENYLEGYIFDKILLKNITTNVVIRKKCFDEVGLYDERFPTRGDHDMFLRIAKKYKFAYIRKPLMKFRVHQERISRDIKKKEKGWKLFLKKWEFELNERPKIKNEVYSKYFYEMGKVNYLNKNYSKSKKLFINSLKKNFSIKKLMLIIFSFLKIDIKLK